MQTVLKAYNQRTPDLLSPLACQPISNARLASMRQAAAQMDPGDVFLEGVAPQVKGNTGVMHLFQHHNGLFRTFDMTFSQATPGLWCLDNF